MAAVGVALIAGLPTANASQHPAQSSSPATERGEVARQIRTATDDFHNIATAEGAGYVPFKDVHGKSCIAMRGLGGMGVHYVNPALIADPSIDPSAPEALVYAPDRDGTLRLAAVEYIVDKGAWDANHQAAPEILTGRAFDEIGAPNRFGLDPFYAQHAWVWKPNPAGLLAMWNPRVNCRFA
jgi:hypothetical protein